MALHTTHQERTNQEAKQPMQKATRSMKHPTFNEALNTNHSQEQIKSSNKGDSRKGRRFNKESNSPRP